MHSNDEKELLMQLREGNAQALDYFYHQYSLRIYRKLLKMVRVETIAEELVQDVFVRIWDKRHQIDPDRSFRSYLFTIAQNLVYDLYRKVAREERLQEVIKDASSEIYMHVEEGVFLKETSEILNKAINNLPSQQKLVFTLCKLEGKSYEDASATLGISTSTINNHIVKATKSIKGYMFREQNAAFFLTISLMLTEI
ncbi:MAG TPA: RNA polymerase sigma factor [Daejeonella sp.]|uniref:RNA polymerase sigma factor n=1 Tax=Daejeonella sp. TaxID=2805397 RepID=UPI002ED8C3D7